MRQSHGRCLTRTYAHTHWPGGVGRRERGEGVCVWGGGGGGGAHRGCHDQVRSPGGVQETHISPCCQSFGRPTCRRGGGDMR